MLPAWPDGDLAVVIAARDEVDRIAATVTAAAAVPGVDLVVVVDDGSSDATAAAAARAGARVARHARNRGKAAAMETGAAMVAQLEAAGLRGPGRDAAPRRQRPGGPRAREQQAGKQAGVRGPRHLLFLDGDLGATAAQAGPLAQPVRSGTADMAIAVFTDRVRRGGHGLVVGLAGAGIERATGWRPAQPLNGQRCLTRAAFGRALPLAPRFGAETGMTIDLLRAGLRVAEVEVPLAHRATGSDWRSQLHRARQLADVAAALAARCPARRR